MTLPDRLTLSFSPLIGPGITAATRIWLGLMHVTTGAVLIPALARSSPKSRG